MFIFRQMKINYLLLSGNGGHHRFHSHHHHHQQQHPHPQQQQIHQHHQVYMLLLLFFKSLNTGFIFLLCLTLYVLRFHEFFLFTYFNFCLFSAATPTAISSSALPASVASALNKPRSSIQYSRPSYASSWSSTSRWVSF